MSSKSKPFYSIDLFSLHDPNRHTSLRKCIMARGELLLPTLDGLLVSINKPQFIKHLMHKYHVSYSSAQRWVHCKKKWIPLFYISEVLRVSKNENLTTEVQSKIQHLKANQPPERIYKAVISLTPRLCKIMGAHAADGTLGEGNLIRITDGYECNIDALKTWIDTTFGINIKKVRIKKSTKEWGLEIRSKIIANYMTNIFGFPYGAKQYFVEEPKIIKQSELMLRKAFAIGALTFEAGVGINNQVELCVSSKSFRDCLSDILTKLQIDHASMKNSSSGYWRLWSRVLTKKKAQKWLDVFEEGTRKWLILKEYSEGYSMEVNDYEHAINILNSIYPKKSGSKVSLAEIIEVIWNLGEISRYQLAKHLCQKNKLKSYGGKWGHSLQPYLKILHTCKIIRIEKRKFGKKKSWGSIIREVYIPNTDISTWRLPAILPKN